MLILVLFLKVELIQFLSVLEKKTHYISPTLINYIEFYSCPIDYELTCIGMSF